MFNSCKSIERKIIFYFSFKSLFWAECWIFPINIYDIPTLTNFSPKYGSTVGYQISIFGLFSNLGEIHCRFGDILWGKTCDFIRTKQIICTVQSHPYGKSTVEISFNKIHWHRTINNTLFEFTTCDSGYTANNYKNPCELCPPGTYKSSAGLYECIKCGNDTYNEFSGALVLSRMSN